MIHRSTADQTALAVLRKIAAHRRTVRRSDLEAEAPAAADLDAVLEAAVDEGMLDEDGEHYRSRIFGSWRKR